MDITAALTPEEVATLSDAERSCEDASNKACKLATRAERDEGIFQASLRLKNTLDVCEEQARSKPSWEALSLLINCEYRLYILNQSTPLRNNPFLSHWIEAMQRFEAPSAKLAAGSNGTLTSHDIFAVRVELLKALLESRNPSQFARKSPKQLYKNFVELRQTGPFDLRTYVRMLEEEGIYERTPEPPEPQSSAPKQNGVATARDAARPRLNDFQQWKQDMLDRLQSEPDRAIRELTHLPVELSYLDFLTTLLQEQTLESFLIDPLPVISDYIQHALRLAEQIGQPASSSSETNGIGNGDTDEFADHGREAQTRVVKLLLLFVRNLIRKSLVRPEAIYFEIQEICVRYVWIREVREFRSFIEEGKSGDVVV